MRRALRAPSPGRGGEGRGLLLALGAAIGAAAIAGASPGCGEQAPPEAGSGGGGGAESAAAGAGGEDAGAPHVGSRSWAECQASDQAFVRKALFALLGRRPESQAEVNAYEDLVVAARKADREEAGPYADIGAGGPPEGGDLEGPRRLAARVMMQDGAFLVRWGDFFMDALRVVRIETKSQAACYGKPIPAAFDDGELAAWVRDADARSKGEGSPLPGFRMGELLSSALVLDDLSPVYRAHLFAMMSLPIKAANVEPLELEIARRHDFGAVFEAAYVHRDLVCLSCHNSEFSVTASDDPSKNRAWPVPGLFERSLYGASNGKHPPEEEVEKGSDLLRSRSMLRFMGVGIEKDDEGNPGEGGEAPYGWSPVCGLFREPAEDDPLGVDTHFGAVRGRRASVWDLERSLRRGVDELAAHGLHRLPGGELADPDEAFAYLVAQNVVEKVWTEIMGSRLTIANYFPRTAVQRDALMAMTERFVASHFSPRALLLDVLAHPAFNLEAPEAGCGAAPYELPPIFDPWTLAEADLGKRANSPADGVFSISARPLRRSLHAAMGWPGFPDYPKEEETDLQTAIGFFLKDAEPGFRGLDFQGRLIWEATYGACQNPGSGPDFVAELAERASETKGASVRDAVLTLKDRLLGEPLLEPGEDTELEALLGASMESSAKDAPELEAGLRRICGLLVSTPQFLLGGLAPKEGREVPRLTAPEHGYASTCKVIAERAAEAEGDYLVTCGAEGLLVEKP